MITLYSTNCPKCKVLEMKLKLTGKDFKIVDTIDEVVEVGKMCGITSAPILRVNDEYYDFSKAVEVIKNM